MRKATVSHGILMAALLGVLGWLVTWNLLDSRQRILADESERIKTQTGVIVRNIERQLLSVNLALEGIVRTEELRDLQRIDQTNRRLGLMVQSMPGVRTILITNAEGRAVASSRPELVGVDASQRDFFSALRDGLDPALLYISSPFKSVLGAYLFSVGRVLTGPDGEFEGVVSAGLDPDYFRTLLQSVLYAPDMISTINHRDGIRFMIEPEREGQVGKNILVPGSMLYRHRESGRQESFFVDVGYATGEYRMMALMDLNPVQYRVDKPLCVIAGRRMDKILANWRHEVWLHGVIFAVFCLLSYLGFFWVSLQEEKRHQVEQEFAVTELNHRIFLTTLLQAIPVPVYYKDNNGVYLGVNSTFADFYNTEPEYFIGKTAFDICPPELAMVYQEKDQELLYQGGTQSFESQVQTPKGRRQVIFRKAVFRDEQGAVAGLIGGMLDITERKNMETALRNANAELIRSNSELEQFAYAASHDLRTPLRAIESLSEWLEEDLAGKIPEESAQHLQLLRNRVRRMDNLLHDLLEYSRAGNLPADLEQVDVAGLVADLVDLLGIGPQFVVECADLPVMTTYGTPLRQVLRNLLCNAVQHHDRGQGRIRVRCQRLPEGYEFTVEDDGPGIPAQFREKAFALFQTLQSRDTTESSGMGLALVKKIVEFHGGVIRMEEARPRGLAVVFTWPVEQAVQEHQIEEGEREPAHG